MLNKCSRRIVCSNTAPENKIRREGGGKRGGMGGGMEERGEVRESETGKVEGVGRGSGERRGGRGEVTSNCSNPHWQIMPIPHHAKSPIS